MTANRPRIRLLAWFAAWWRDLRAARARLGELTNSVADAGSIARDIGITRSELYSIAAKRPDAADQLKLRLEALHVDRAAVVRDEPMVMRDLERVCSQCGSTRRCKRDWKRFPDDAAWRSYCPNATTLDALAAGSPTGESDGVCT
ncbi:MAG TPA: hypothetical protein VEK73_04330 [Xanthobacteraceae bacterium]|nr:hypothetical protein [Xanthobacteraceae bacterium]